MTSSESRSALASYCINFIDKDNTWSTFFCFLKKISYAGSSYTHKHFHKFRSTDVKKRNIRFSGNSASEQCFSCSGRSHEQNPFWNFCAQFNEFFGIFKEVYFFFQFFFCFFCSGDIRKGNFIFVFFVSFFLSCLSKKKNAAIGSLHLANKKP